MKNKINKIIRGLPKVREMDRKLTQLRGLAEDEWSRENLRKSPEDMRKPVEAGGWQSLLARNCLAGV